MLDSRISTNPAITESYFAVLSKDLVLEVNKGDYTVTAKDNTVYGPFTMVNTLVWINRDGAWKMIHFHESWQRKKNNKYLKLSVRQADIARDVKCLWPAGRIVAVSLLKMPYALQSMSEMANIVTSSDFGWLKKAVICAHDFQLPFPISI